MNECCGHGGSEWSDPECCICADQPCTSVTADRRGRHQRAAAASDARWTMRRRPWDEAPF